MGFLVFGLFLCLQGVSYIPQKGETNQFNADADGEAGSKNVVWDDLKTLFPDVMNESQVGSYCFHLRERKIPYY